MTPSLTPLILSALILSTAAGPLGYNGGRLQVRDAPPSNSSFPAVPEPLAASIPESAVALPALEPSPVVDPLGAQGLGSDNTAIVPLSPSVLSDTPSVVTFLDPDGRPVATETLTTLAVTSYLPAGTAPEESLPVATESDAVESPPLADPAPSSSAASGDSEKQQGAVPALGNGPRTSAFDFSSLASTVSATAEVSSSSLETASVATSQASEEQPDSALALDDGPSTPVLDVSSSAPATSAPDAPSPASSTADSLTASDPSEKQQGSVPAAGNSLDSAPLSFTSAAEGEAPASTAALQTEESVGVPGTSAQNAVPVVNTNAPEAGYGDLQTKSGVSDATSTPTTNVASATAAAEDALASSSVVIASQSLSNDTSIVSTDQASPPSSDVAPPSAPAESASISSIEASQSLQDSGTTAQIAPTDTVLAAPSQLFTIYATSIDFDSAAGGSTATPQPFQSDQTSSSVEQLPPTNSPLDSAESSPATTASSDGASVEPVPSSTVSTAEDSPPVASSSAPSQAPNIASVSSSPQLPGPSEAEPTSSSVLAAPSPPNAVPDVTITLPGPPNVLQASDTLSLPSSSAVSSAAPPADDAGSSSLPGFVGAPSALPQPTSVSADPIEADPTSEYGPDSPEAPILATTTTIFFSETATSTEEAPGITIIPIDSKGVQGQARVVAAPQGDIDVDDLLAQGNTVTVTATTTETATATVTATVTATILSPV
ncbi:MAG: hypothetical protein M1815_000759 [Lichina confinis]|nr:MAG: hypothetical protein M1815_000759 [Lichina confinis]